MSKSRRMLAEVIEKESFAEAAGSTEGSNLARIPLNRPRLKKLNNEPKPASTPVMRICGNCRTLSDSHPKIVLNAEINEHDVQPFLFGVVVFCC